MRRTATLLVILIATAWLIPGCYTYESQTADLGFMADGWGDQGAEEDVVEDTGNGTDTNVGDAVDVTEDVPECTCTCEPQPCTCTCEPGGECTWDPNGYPETGRVGGDPCTLDTQCVTGLCATDALLGAVWPGATAPDGMCTMIGCSSAADCGEGAICLDPTALDPTVPFLCGAPCETDIDCRCGVDYTCLDSQKTDGSGNPIKACLPRSLKNLLECGAAVCE